MLGMYQVQPGQVAYGMNLQTYKPGGPVFQEPTVYSFSRPQYQTISSGPGPLTQTLSDQPPGSFGGGGGGAAQAVYKDVSNGYMRGRGRLIESYIASAPSAPVESFMGPSAPEPSMESSYESAEPPSIPAPSLMPGGATFMSAEIDASRSPSAAAAIAHGRIRGDNIVRGQFGI